MNGIVDAERHASPPRCRSAIDSQSGNDQSERDEQPAAAAGWRRARCANFSAIRAEQRRRAPTAARARAARSVASEPLRVAGEHEQHHERDQRADAAAIAPAHFTGVERDRVRQRRARDRRRTRKTPAAPAPSAMSSTARGRRREGAGRAQPFVPREKIRANDLAGARRQHAAARRTRRPSRETRCRNASCPSGSSRYCQRHARIARFTNIVASDSASHSGRALDDLAPTRREDRRCAGTTRAGRPPSASTTMRAKMRSHAA